MRPEARPVLFHSVSHSCCADTQRPLCSNTDGDTSLCFRGKFVTNGRMLSKYRLAPVVQYRLQHFNFIKIHFKQSTMEYLKGGLIKNIDTFTYHAYQSLLLLHTFHFCLSFYVVGICADCMLECTSTERSY